MSGSEGMTRAGAPAQTLPVIPQLALAALCAAAGTVHLVMVPGHSQDSTLDGILFLLAGWAQLGLAVALVAWPSRDVVRATLPINATIAVAWAVSRTFGLPFGGQAGDREAAGTVDQMTTASEVLAVILAVAVLLRPGVLRTANKGATALAAVVPVGVLVVTSVMLTSSETADHHEAAGPAVPTQLVSASQRCDLGLNPASYWRDVTTAGYDTVNGTTAATAAGTAGNETAAGGHGHHGAPAAAATGEAVPAPVPDVDDGRGSADLDRLMALSTEAGEGAEARLVMALADVSDEVYDAWLQRLSSTATHAGPQPWTAMTSQEDCDRLAEEIETARDFALAHPTPVEAEAAGYRRVTGYVPGIAAHYINFSYIDDTFELDRPEMLLYDGTGPNASVTGLSYYITMGAEVEPTQGYTGPNDRYHVHVGLCMRGTSVVGDSTTTEEECAARGGVKSGGSGNWMSHAWVVPGCESPWGVFSSANPLLDGALGQASGTDGGGCAGSGVRDRYDLEPGTIDNTPTPVTEAEVQMASP